MSHSQQLTIQQAISEAKKATKQGKVAIAMEIYAAILQQQPNHPIAKKRLRKLQKELPQNQSAEEETSNPPQDQITALVDVYNAGQMAETEQTCKELLQSYPQSLVVMNVLGAALSGQGKFKESIRVNDRAIQLKPDFTEAYNNRGNALRALGKLDEAVKSYEKAVQLTPDFAQAHSNLGLTFHDLGQLDAAVNSYEQALAIDPGLAATHSNLGLTLHDLGQLSAAVKSYEKALMINPDYAEAHNNFGNTLKELGQLNAAIKCYEQALLINPDFAEAHNNLGNPLKDLGQLDAAAKSYERALTINPDYTEAHSNLGLTLHERGQLDAAIGSYERALAINPDFAKAHNNLGLIFHERGQLDAAINCYDKALMINPDYAEAHNNLGNTFKELDQRDAAVKCYDKAVMINPDYAEAHSNLGGTLKELGQLDAAVNSYERALELNPKDHSTRHLLSSLLGQNRQSAPYEYIESLFNNYADKFDDSLVDKLEYSMPLLLRKSFLDSNLANNKICKTIDLGCGTGLSGAEFRDLTKTLIGIDISNKMIAKAEEKNIYDELYVNDLINGLKELGGKFDLFISSDVFVYVGDLRALFKTIREHANKYSLFIFSTEDEDGDNFHLQKSGRFSHSKKYITQLASTLGFQLVLFEKSKLRKENKQWIIGGIYILRSI